MTSVRLSIMYVIPAFQRVCTSTSRHVAEIGRPRADNPILPSFVSSLSMSPKPHDVIIARPGTYAFLTGSALPVRLGYPVLPPPPLSRATRRTETKRNPRFSGAGLRRVLVGAVVFIGVAQTASGSSASRLRARQSQQHQQQQQVQNGNSKASGPEYQHGRRLTNGDGGEVAVPDQGRFGLGLPQQQSLKSTRDPQCNLPEELSCTLNTTAIGMVENGFATYYDE